MALKSEFTALGVRVLPPAGNYPQGLLRKSCSPATKIIERLESSAILGPLALVQRTRFTPPKTGPVAAIVPVDDITSYASAAVKPFPLSVTIALHVDASSPGLQESLPNLIVDAEMRQLCH